MIVGKRESNQIHPTSQNMEKVTLTLPTTNIVAPENRPAYPKGQDRILTIHFQV